MRLKWSASIGKYNGNIELISTTMALLSKLREVGLR